MQPAACDTLHQEFLSFSEVSESFSGQPLEAADPPEVPPVRLRGRIGQSSPEQDMPFPGREEAAPCGRCPL